jgi:ferrochelatase
MEKTSIILTALGGPLSIAEVGPFMNAFMARPFPPQVLASIQERYRLIGGKSPLVDIVKSQAAALEKELGPGHSVYAGFRHSNPTIGDACSSAISDGALKIIALSLSPFETSVTTGSYKKALDESEIPVGSLTFVPSFHDNPFFIKSWQESVAACLSGTGGPTAVIFTSHSIPLRSIESGDPYKKQIEETVGLIAARAGLTRWSIAWQSRGARAAEPWLEPDVETVMSHLAESGVKKIVEAPVGFTCDHLETLYDIDIVHKSFAEKLGLEFRRVPSLNVNPLFIRALADVVRRAGAFS